MSDPLVEAYPPFGLRITHDDMTLRVFRDADMPEYLDLLSAPIFAEENVDWFFPWCEAPVPERRRNAIQAHWGWRSGFRPESWTLAFGVYVDTWIYVGGVLVGCQDLISEEFAKRRVVHSGSWLALEHQGRGWGSRMRRLLLHFAFDHLGAQRAESEAVKGNESSLGVSRSAGYESNGTRVEIFGKRVVASRRTHPRPAPSPRRRGRGGGIHRGTARHDGSGVEHNHPASLHGLMSSIPRPSKSRMFRVARMKPRAEQMAAISESITGIHRPLPRHLACNSAQTSAAASSKTNTRPANRGRTTVSSAATSRSRRRPGGSSAAPSRNSATLRAVMNSVSACC